MKMKLIISISVVLFAVLPLISSSALSISKDALAPRVFTEPEPDPVRVDPNRAPLSPQEIVQQYPTFLDRLNNFPADGKDAGNMWLPPKENKQDLLKAPSQGRSGVYIDGRIAVAQFGKDDLPKPAFNLLASGYTSWRDGDEVDSDEDHTPRQRALATLRQKGRSVGSVLTSGSAARVQAEFKAPEDARMPSFEVAVAFALERAAQLLARDFNLDDVQFRVSESNKQKANHRRGLESDMSTVRGVLRRHNPTAQLQERSGLLTEIAGQVQSTSSGNSNSTTDLAADFQLYQYALSAVQNNISSLLFPFFDTITAKTNSDLVYDILWSVYQDLTGISNFTGPFMSGWNCLDMLENQYTNQTNSTSKNGTEDPETLEYLAVHQIVLDIYNYAWTNGSAAVNKTGLLKDLAALSSFYLSLNQSSLPPDFLTQAAPNYDYNYFKNRNPSGGSNGSVFFDFKLPQWD